VFIGNIKLPPQFRAILKKVQNFLYYAEDAEASSDLG